MPPSPQHSTLVLPQHILANPLDALGGQAPLAALFALNACFVDESVGIVSSRLLLLFPASYPSIDRTNAFPSSVPFQNIRASSHCPVM